MNTRYTKKVSSMRFNGLQCCFYPKIGSWNDMRVNISIQIYVVYKKYTKHRAYAEVLWLTHSVLWSFRVGPVDSLVLRFNLWVHWGFTAAGIWYHHITKIPKVRAVISLALCERSECISCHLSPRSFFVAGSKNVPRVGKDWNIWQE